MAPGGRGVVALLAADLAVGLTLVTERTFAFCLVVITARLLVEDAMPRVARVATAFDVALRVVHLAIGAVGVTAGAAATPLQAEVRVVVAVLGALVNSGIVVIEVPHVTAEIMRVHRRVERPARHLLRRHADGEDVGRLRVEAADLLLVERAPVDADRADGAGVLLVGVPALAAGRAERRVPAHGARREGLAPLEASATSRPAEVHVSDLPADAVAPLRGDDLDLEVHLADLIAVAEDVESDPVVLVLVEAAVRAGGCGVHAAVRLAVLVEVRVSAAIFVAPALVDVDVSAAIGTGARRGGVTAGREQGEAPWDVARAGVVRAVRDHCTRWNPTYEFWRAKRCEFRLPTTAGTGTRWFAAIDALARLARGASPARGDDVLPDLNVGALGPAAARAHLVEGVMRASLGTGADRQRNVLPVLARVVAAVAVSCVHRHGHATPLLVGGLPLGPVHPAAEVGAHVCSVEHSVSVAAFFGLLGSAADRHRVGVGDTAVRGVRLAEAAAIVLVVAVALVLPLQAHELEAAAVCAEAESRACRDSGGDVQPARQTHPLASHPAVSKRSRDGAWVEARRVRPREVLVGLRELDPAVRRLGEAEVLTDVDAVEVHARAAVVHGQREVDPHRRDEAAASGVGEWGVPEIFAAVVVAHGDADDVAIASGAVHIAVCAAKLDEDVRGTEVALAVHVRVEHLVRLLRIVARGLGEPEGDCESAVGGVALSAREHGVVTLAVEGEAKAGFDTAREAGALVLERVAEHLEIVVRAGVDEAPHVRWGHVLVGTHQVLVDRVAIGAAAHVFQLWSVKTRTSTFARGTVLVGVEIVANLSLIIVDGSAFTRRLVRRDARLRLRHGSCVRAVRFGRAGGLVIHQSVAGCFGGDRRAGCHVSAELATTRHAVVRGPGGGALDGDPFAVHLSCVHDGAVIGR